MMSTQLNKRVKQVKILNFFKKNSFVITAEEPIPDQKYESIQSSQQLTDNMAVN